MARCEWAGDTCPELRSSSTCEVPRLPCSERGLSRACGDRPKSPPACRSTEERHLLGAHCEFDFQFTTCNSQRKHLTTTHDFSAILLSSLPRSPIPIRTRNGPQRDPFTDKTEARNPHPPREQCRTRAACRGRYRTCRRRGPRRHRTGTRRGGCSRSLTSGARSGRRRRGSSGWVPWGTRTCCTGRL